MNLRNARLAINSSTMMKAPDVVRMDCFRFNVRPMVDCHRLVSHISKSAACSLDLVNSKCRVKCSGLPIYGAAALTSLHYENIRKRPPKRSASEAST